MSDGRRLIRKSRETSANFDLYEPEGGSLEIYVDGFSGGRSDASVSRLDFHVVVGASDEEGSEVEQRILRLRLVIPTERWFEILALFIRGAPANADKLNSALTEKVSRMSEFFELLKKIHQDEKK